MNSNKVLGTPFIRQCFVTLGVTMNVMCIGMDSGYSSVLFPQLRQGRYIEIDDESLSWLASIIGFSLIVGAVIAPSIMSKKGRRTALILGSICNITGWVLFILARNMPMLLAARVFHGLCFGIDGVVAQVTIGEYTSPKNRGAFLVLYPFFMFFGSTIQHVQGVFLTWKVVAVVSLGVNIIAMLIVMLSPETPSFLATRGRYDCCRSSFRWLRGNEEDEELDKMIKAAMLINTSSEKKNRGVLKVAKDKFHHTLKAMKKKEVYKPVIIVMHLQFLNLYSGSLLNDTYANEIFMAIFGNFTDMYYVFWSLDTQRILTSALSMIMIHKVKRRKVLLLTVTLNILVYITIAGYVYGIKLGLFPSYLAVGTILLHIHYFTFASGCSVMPNIIAGEIYPLEYRGTCGMISTLSFSMYLIIKFKTVPFLFNTIGLHGAYLLYACLVCYSLVVLMILLPETKDKTLQDIEIEFRDSAGSNQCTDKLFDLSSAESKHLNPDEREGVA